MKVIPARIGGMIAEVDQVNDYIWADALNRLDGLSSINDAGNSGADKWTSKLWLVLTTLTAQSWRSLLVPIFFREAGRPYVNLSSLMLFESASRFLSSVQLLIMPVLSSMSLPATCR